MKSDQNRESVRVPVERLKGAVSHVLQAAGVPKPQADIVAKVLLFADQRGIESHGVSKLPIYVKRIQDGGIDPTAIPHVIGGKGATVRIDGKNALGPVAGVFGMEQAIEAARRYGIGVASVKNSNHFGVTAYYSMMAIPEGMIGFAFSNANPTVAPWGGKQAMVGTSPLSVAIPSASGLPFVIDMATTTVARGKIILYARNRKPLPPGWALDSEGRETTDPEVALKGLLTPLGGAKGSGLALTIDILCGMVSGAKYLTEVGHLYSGTDRPQGIGHLFLALEIDAFLPRNQFLEEMDRYIDNIHSCPKAEGVERIYVPGELEYESMKKTEKEGVEVSTITRDELVQTAKAVGVDPAIFAFS
ncbi:MAG: Ldh family oxidoreductase [Spirochaetes bacterium]|nr:Ldh family oxidoreductase [Spirochaetota bacterium]